MLLETTPLLDRARLVLRAASATLETLASTPQPTTDQTPLAQDAVKDAPTNTPKAELPVVIIDVDPSAEVPSLRVGQSVSVVRWLGAPATIADQNAVIETPLPITHDLPLTQGAPRSPASLPLGKTPSFSGGFLPTPRTGGDAALYDLWDENAQTATMRIVALGRDVRVPQSAENTEAAYPQRAITARVLAQGSDGSLVIQSSQGVAVMVRAGVWPGSLRETPYVVLAPVDVRVLESGTPTPNSMQSSPSPRNPNAVADSPFEENAPTAPSDRRQYGSTSLDQRVQAEGLQLGSERASASPIPSLLTATLSSQSVPQLDSSLARGLLLWFATIAGLPVAAPPAPLAGVRKIEARSPSADKAVQRGMEQEGSGAASPPSLANAEGLNLLLDSSPSSPRLAPSGWTLWSIPLATGEPMHPAHLPLHLYVRNAVPDERRAHGSHDDSAPKPEDPEAAHAHHFVLSITLDSLGTVAIEGLTQPRTLALTIWSARAMDPRVMRELTAHAHETLESVGYQGHLRFKVGEPDIGSPVSSHAPTEPSHAHT